MKSIKSYSEQIERLNLALRSADAIIVGGGAGLSTSAGFTYSGKRFEEHFADFIDRYGFQDMYSGGFYPYETPEEHWAYWSRYIFINRYDRDGDDVYHNLLNIVRDKDYFVVTTNVDHCFQKAGIDKERLFYTQGDYGLWQCSRPCHTKTYDNEETVRQMVAEQKNMRIPPDLIPYCPACGAPMSMNLRADRAFVEDFGWHRAKERYEAYLRRRGKGRILFLELGVGGNTPVIIKYPFWQMAWRNPHAVYACINLGEAHAPSELRDRAICIDEDIGKVLMDLTRE